MRAPVNIGSLPGSHCAVPCGISIGFSSLTSTVAIPGCVVSVISHELPAYSARRGSALR